MDNPRPGHLDASLFSVGAILGRTAGLLKAKAGLFLPIGFAFALATDLVYRFTPEDSWFYWGMAIVANILILSLLDGLLACLSYMWLKSRVTPLGEAASRVLARFFPLLLAGLIYSGLATLGLAVLIIPGMFLYALWAAAIPACVVEGLGPLASLKRSAELTRGYRLKIFGLMIICLAIVIVLGLADAIVERIVDHETTLLLVRSVLAAPAYAFGAILNVVIYYDLRAIREGGKLGGLSDVFD